MSKISFKPRTITNTKSSYASINIHFTDGKGGYFRLTTGQQIKSSKNFNSKLGRVRDTSAEPNRKKINNYLRKLETHCKNAIQEYELDNIDINKETANKILLSYGDSKQSKVITNKFNFNEEYTTFLRLIKGEDLKPGEQRLYQKKGAKPFGVRTVKNYGSVFHLFKSFQENYGAFTLKNINHNTYIKLVNYLRDECEKEYRNSHIDKVLAQFKAFISNYLIDEKRYVLPNYIAKEWSGVSSKDELSFEIYLDNNELKTMFMLNLNEFPKSWGNYRDAFLFIAYTCGIRVDDYMNCSASENIRKEKDGTYTFFYKPSKNSNYIEATIPPPALRILERHNWELPFIANPQKSNDILKEIGKLCGFNKIETWLETRGLKTETKTDFRYDLIKNHTARRSFCTNAYKSGIDSLTIMQFSGHKDFDVFLRYIRVTKKEFMDKMKTSKLYKMYCEDEDFKSILNIA